MNKGIISPMQKPLNLTFFLPSIAIDILNGLIIALLFSSFIYFEHFELTQVSINTLFALMSVYALLVMNRKTVLAAGFFIGLLWFYWIGYSFEYYHVGWMTPVITFMFAIIYMLFFGVLALTDCIWLRAVLLFILSYVEPFDWNWMQVELIFIDTWFGVEKWQFILVLTGLVLFAMLKTPLRYLAIVPLLAALQFGIPEKELPPLSIKLVTTAIPQAIKWDMNIRSQTVEANFSAIREAIKEGYELVVLPESVFPLFLNHNPLIEGELRALSYHIAIVTGAIYEEDGQNYNVGYFFHRGKVQIAKKMVLVPFGEYIPLPSFMKSWVNNTFFDGASDYVNATHPSDFNVSGTIFRNAVCYEATCEELYEGDPKFMVAMSNNAWFHPSIEPTLQRLLMRYYARKHGTIIFHSANMGGSGIIY